MAVIEKFLGQRVEIPEDRRYHSKQGLSRFRPDAGCPDSGRRDQ
jgi:hypothetical protein